ncbi:MAG: hypothetical protein HY718_07230 [Planctomycetes bacterium]|nr:hypothetical protein [Planctomycetota bacterium]
MFKVSSVARRVWICLALGLPPAGIASCTGTGANVTSGVLGSIVNIAKSSALIVRVVNGTDADLEVTIRVDGDTKVLPACSALQRTCDYVLTTCPGIIELLQEVRRDDNEVFVGGRNFEGDAAFIFQQGDYQCGGTIIYQFTDTNASALAF